MLTTASDTAPTTIRYCAADPRPGPTGVMNRFGFPVTRPLRARRAGRNNGKTCAAAGAFEGCGRDPGNRPDGTPAKRIMLAGLKRLCQCCTDLAESAELG